MENRRNCPACGVELTKNAEKCPICGLVGLNQVFLSRADYEKWVEEALKSHVEKLSYKVFAGHAHGLILTVWGDLYGIGDNSRRQLTDTAQQHYDQPVLIARDVISAAALNSETCYVTQDGKSHWQPAGGEYPQFADVRAVYGDNWDPRCWMVRNTGEVLCFGENDDEVLAERRKQLALQLPEVAGVMDGWRPPIRWLDNDTTSARPEDRFLGSAEIQTLERQYGPRNVVLDMNKVKPNMIMEAFYAAFATGLVVYKPVIWTVNMWISISEPIPFEGERWADCPHRIAGRPLLKEEYRKYEWDKLPGVTKAVAYGGGFNLPELSILEDRTVATHYGEKLEWMEQTAVDIAMSHGMILIACANGDILWCKNMEEVKSGTMNRCRLPMNT